MNRSLFFFLIVAPLSCGLFVLSNMGLEAKRNDLMLNQAKVIQNEVHERLRLYLHGTMGARIVASAFWEQIIVEDNEYRKLADALVTEFPEIYGVNQVEPNGLISRVYPEEKNRRAKGLISQNIQFLKASLERNEKFWFSPPFDLYQGERGFVCYVPLNRQGKHLGWLAIVITTDRFFDYFTDNEFGKNFHVEVVDSKTGQHYIDGPVSSADYRGELLFKNTLTQFGREIVVKVWPKNDITPPAFPWLVPLGLALLVSLIATLAFSWWTQREEALQSLASLNNLLRLTIHDTAASLTSIKGYLEIMKNDSSLVPIERLSRHVGFIVDLLDQMKLVRHLSTSNESWKKERLPLLDLVLEVSEVMSERLRNKDILLRYDPEALSQAHMTLNRGLFAHSVLVNLLSNAIMFSPLGSTIVISHRVVDGMHEVDVLDRGPGVPELTLKQLKQKKLNDAGTSFGLLIAQQVVELHGGELQFHNSVDGASIVRVRIPA
jgi:signal transduction histidine kinase